MEGGRTTDSVINSFCIRNDSDISKTLTDNVHYVTVELPKFRKEVSDLSTLADRMIWLLRNMGSLKSVPEEFSGKGLEKLFDISNFTAMTYEEQMDYLAKFHAELDRAAEMEAAIDKGLKKGLEKGREEGREEERERSRLEKLETARKLKVAGIDVETISQCTGLAQELIDGL